MKKSGIFLLLFFSLIIANMSAQNSQKPCPCCTENHQQFDFWLGEWDVYDPNGNIAGTNTITKLYDGCVMQEKWVSAGPSRGTSYNCFDKSDQSWNQIWVDNTGFVLNLKGKLIANAMVLKSVLQQGQNGKFYHQISWIPNDDGTVTQLWETFDEHQNKTGELFRGTYKKKLN